jgi:xylulokinase
MAGSSILAWFKDMCFGEDPVRDEAEVYREIEASAASVGPGCDGLLFHPYLYGERSPFYNPQARGSFLAIAHWHHRAHFIRSIMEGVAFCIGNCFDVIKAIAASRNETIEKIRTGEGGGSRLQVWRQIITDVLEVDLEVVQVEEPGCLGAALLAGMGVGEYEDLVSATDGPVHVGSRISPDVDSSAFYRERRRVFNHTYRALESILYLHEEAS